jgi:hypothetical protein
MMYTHMNKCINNLKKQTVPNLEINNIVWVSSASVENGIEQHK